RKSGFLGRLFGAAQREPLEVHPMAFEFPRRNADLLYFPTLHVHDRMVTTYATFDHVLYCQPEEDSPDWLAGWRQSLDSASRYVQVEHAEGIVAPDRPLWQLKLKGRLRNKDTLVGKDGQIPQAATG